MNTFDPGKPVDWTPPATQQVITPDAVARGAVALDQAFPTLGRDFTGPWFIKAATVVLSAALGLPAPGADELAWPEQPADHEAAAAAELEAGAGAVRIDDEHVEVELADGRPMWFAPIYVVSVQPAEPYGYNGGPDAYTGPLTAVQLSHTPTAWLVRGEAAFIAEQVWP